MRTSYMESPLHVHISAILSGSGARTGSKPHPSGEVSVHIHLSNPIWRRGAWRSDRIVLTWSSVSLWGLMSASGRWVAGSTNQHLLTPLLPCLPCLEVAVTACLPAPIYTVNLQLSNYFFIKDKYSLSSFKYVLMYVHLISGENIIKRLHEKRQNTIAFTNALWLSDKIYIIVILRSQIFIPYCL